jgi:hypothetical protein
MKKPSSRIREEITKLQDQLKAAETREAERIGRVALRAGLGEIEVEETDLHVAFEDLVKRFRGAKQNASGRKGESRTGSGQTEKNETFATGTPAGCTGED